MTSPVPSFRNIKHPSLSAGICRYQDYVNWINEIKRQNFQRKMAKLGPDKTKEFLKRYPHRLEFCI